MMMLNSLIRLVAALALMFSSFTSLRAEGQAGAEKTKIPVKVAVVDAVKWNSETVGNIEVRYADGTRDRWPP